QHTPHAARHGGALQAAAGTLAVHRAIGPLKHRGGRGQGRRFPEVHRHRHTPAEGKLRGRLPGAGPNCTAPGRRR
ncbi:MAG: hypothetical protein ACK56F_28990, partial [bacterium]